MIELLSDVALVFACVGGLLYLRLHRENRRFQQACWEEQLRQLQAQREEAEHKRLAAKRTRLRQEYESNADYIAELRAFLELTPEELLERFPDGQYPLPPPAPGSDSRS